MVRLKVIFQQVTPQQQRCGGWTQASESLNEMCTCWIVYYEHRSGAEA